MYRLTNEPGGLGLSCTAAGLSLAGVPLLEKRPAGFAPRPAPEIASLIRAAFGADGDPTRLEASLGVIARALNGGDLARAGIAAVLTRTPELSREGAARLAKADGALAKYDPDEPRDWHGRWTTGGAAGPAGQAAPAEHGAGARSADAMHPRVADSGSGGGGHASLAPVVLPPPEDDAADDSRKPPSLVETFEREYDWLGPVDFAKQVIQFGDRLGREGGSLSSADKERALAEYAFLEDRLSFWLAYEYTPPSAQGNLHSAALVLFQGANNAGIVDPGHLPKSMLDVAGEVWAIDNLPPRVRFSAAPKVESRPEAAVEAPAERAEEKPAEAPAPAEAPVPVPKEVEGLGGIVNNRDAKIDWKNGIWGQGGNWETYIEKLISGIERLSPYSKTFDLFSQGVGEAISAKTMNTLCISYVMNPQMIYWRMKKYIDSVVYYSNPRPDIDLEPGDIFSKSIYLAIPEYTSPTQWRYLYAAIFYGKERGVRIAITRIRE
jgi:hypothetical protein